MESRATTQSVLRIPFRRLTQQDFTTKASFAVADLLGNDVSAKISDESHPEKDHMLRRLSQFLVDLNSQNWNEYGACPIEREAYENAVLIINHTPEEVLKLWHVFPSPNGTISFEFRNREIAAMSVGNSDFSYVARRKQDRKAVKGKKSFDYNDAVEALRVMSIHLGYL